MEPRYAGLVTPRVPVYGRTVFAVIALVAFSGWGCITRQAPTDTESSITAPSAVTAGSNRADSRSGVRIPPTATTPSTLPSTTVAPPATVTVAYQQDLKPVFDADCVRCHSGSRPDGNYSMVTYAQVMRAVTPGNASSVLIRFTQRGGSMYRYWSGNAQAKADLTRNWIVNNAAAESR